MHLLNNFFKLLKRKSKLILLLFVGSLTIFALLFFTDNSTIIKNYFLEFDDPENLISIGIVSLTILMYLGASVFQKLINVWIQKKRGLLGSKLQSRIITIFAIITIIPIVISSASSSLFLRYKVQSWSDSKVHMAFKESINLSKKYAKELERNTVSDAISISYLLTYNNFLETRDKKLLQQFTQEQSDLRKLAEIVIFTPNTIIVKGTFTFALNFEIIPIPDLEKANAGEVVVSFDKKQAKIRALLKLKTASPTYLLIGHLANEQELHHVKAITNLYKTYKDFENKISRTQLEFSIMFALTSCVLLLCSMLIGIRYANKIVAPMTHLFHATQKIEAGNLSIRVEEGPEGEEITTLEKAFNRMISKLKQQREKLQKAYEDINNKKIFTEAILSRISSGVISVDSSYKITLSNECAKKILQISDTQSNLKQVAPEIAQLIQDNIVQKNISIIRNKGLINIYIKINKLNVTNNMYVITFDDISELVQAQKAAAWSDVAKMIAHEIKNPITPMYMSAERLSSLYSKQITHDLKDYIKCTDIIKKHVMNVKRIVNEFVKFAQMPRSVLEKCNINQLIEETVFSERIRDPTIHFQVSVPKEQFYISGDSSQIMTVFMNLLKNAKEALLQTNKAQRLVQISLLKVENGMIKITISDNGQGFPRDLINKLTEPYITTKKSGNMGLGLSIIQKIIDEHKGHMSLYNTKEGAQVEIRLPEYEKPKEF